MTSLTEILSKLVMVTLLDFGRMRGWVTPRYDPNIHHSTTLFNRKMFRLAMCYPVPPLNISFKRALIGDKWDAWSHLCHRLMEVQLLDTDDTFVWNLTANGIFTVKSLYEDSLNGHTRFLRKDLWKLKIAVL